MCSWTQSYGDTFDWTRQMGSTASVGTGPDGDHTDPSGLGHYIYIESSSPRVQGDTADFVSPLIPGGHSYCLQFALHMYGSHLGSVNIYVLLSHRHKIPVKVYTHADYGLLGQQIWYVKDVYIPIVPLNFNIVIEGVVGTDYHSDAAIDDIKIRQGACP